MEDLNTEHFHDPREFIRGVQQILISDTKRIGFLFGAGTSMAVKKQTEDGLWESVIPGINQMTNIIVNSIDNEKYSCALKIIKEELEAENLKIQIENILSQITQKAQVVGNNELCGLTKNEFNNLKATIEVKIKELVSVHENLDISSLIHSEFARWISQASRKNPIEIYTTNYDYLFEIGLEHYNVAYFDGFIGGYKPFFDSNAVEDNSLTWTRLWKLHGSLGWEYDKVGKKIIRGNKESGKIIVYPSILKYDNSKKQPYVSLIDRLCTFLRREDGILFVCGYSFGDQHINETIMNALARTRTSHVIALAFDDFSEDSHIARLAQQETRLSVYGKRNAVIGGKFGKWKLKNEPSKDDSINIDLYFDEDAAEPGKDWSGEGSFTLVDFQKLVKFLSFLNYANYMVEMRSTNEHR